MLIGFLTQKTQILTKSFFRVMYKRMDPLTLSLLCIKKITKMERTLVTVYVPFFEKWMNGKLFFDLDYPLLI